MGSDKALMGGNVGNFAALSYSPSRMDCGGVGSLEHDDDVCSYSMVSIASLREVPLRCLQAIPRHTIKKQVKRDDMRTSSLPTVQHPQ